MKRKLAALLAALLIVSLTGCKEDAGPLPAPEEPPVVEAELPPMPEPAPVPELDKPTPVGDEGGARNVSTLEIGSVEENVDYKFSTLMIETENSEAEEIINSFYQDAADKVKDAVWGEIYEACLAEQTVAEVETYYTAMYNKGGLLSVMRGVTVYSAGSDNPVLHVSSEDAETFVLKTGGLLTLDDLFTVSDSEYLPRLYDAARQHFWEATGVDEQYEQTWLRQVEAAYEKEFCLRDDGVLYLIYPQEAMGPLVPNLVLIPLEDLQDILVDFRCFT